MKRWKEFLITMLIAFFGLMIGAAMNLGGWLGVILTIATMGAFILEEIEKKK